MNRRKFLSYIGCSCCGFILPSCSSAPITNRSQLKIIPESRLNTQAAQIYEKIKKKEKREIMNFEDKIKELKIELPEAKAPVGNYVATKIVGNLLYVSGQVSINSNGELIKGKVGKDLTTDDAYKAAERCGLSIVAQVKNACDGDLSKVKSCIKLTGFVNSTEDFTEQPKVINGASDLIASIFGESGMHTRAAVSTNSLPLGVSVEVDAIFELN